MPTGDTILIFLSALLQAYVAWKVGQTHKAVVQTEMNTNSLVSTLVASTDAEAMARGLKQGREETKP
jgi:hypothetical protein